MSHAMLMTALKAVLWDLGHVKQEPLPPPTPGRGPGGYPYPRHYEGPPLPISRLNQAKEEQRVRLRGELGRDPTHQELRAVMKPIRQRARAEGNPMPRTNPDNFWAPYLPPWPGTYPHTLDNRQMKDHISAYLRDNNLPPLSRREMRTAMSELQYYGYRDQPEHPIDPNAHISRGRFDPRVPERWFRQFGVPDPAPGQARLPGTIQEEADRVRRLYYHWNPTLAPVPGQPGYRQYQRFLERQGGGR